MNKLIISMGIVLGLSIAGVAAAGCVQHGDIKYKNQMLPYYLCTSGSPAPALTDNNYYSVMSDRDNLLNQSGLFPYGAGGNMIYHCNNGWTDASDPTCK